MHLEIADTVLQQAQLSAAEVKLELAVLLWQRGGLTETGAALLAGQSLPAFYAELRRRKLLPSQPVTSLKGMPPPPARVLQAGKRLAELGGTQPQLESIPRRREETA